MSVGWRDLDNNHSQSPFQWAVKQCRLDRRVYMEDVNRQNMERTSGNPKTVDNTRYPGQGRQLNKKWLPSI